MRLLFHTKSNLLCVVCQCPFCSKMYFSLIKGGRVFAKCQLCQFSPQNFEVTFAQCNGFAWLTWTWAKTELRTPQSHRLGLPAVVIVTAPFSVKISVLLDHRRQLFLMCKWLSSMVKESPPLSHIESHGRSLGLDWHLLLPAGDHGSQCWRLSNVALPWETAFPIFFFQDGRLRQCPALKADGL